LKDEAYLPSMIPDARILTYDYDVDTSGDSLATLEDHAENLVKRLYRERIEVRCFSSLSSLTNASLRGISVLGVQLSSLPTA
jgi:hypothetical protein